MDLIDRFRYRPQLDMLEDRALPNSLLGLQDAFAHKGGPALGELSLLNLEAAAQNSPTPTGTTSGPQSGQDSPAPGPQTAGNQTSVPIQTPNPVTSNSTQGAVFFDGPARQGSNNPGVLPPQSHPFGKTYGQWEAALWQWTFSLPADQHPLTDTAPPSTGQTGHVWFLGGTFAPTVGPGGEFIGHVTRDASIPAGTALFFPILNVESSTAEGNGTTAAALSANSKYLADFIDPSSLFVTVDGQSLHDLSSYRAQSPLFTFGPLPANNLLGAPAGTTSPSVSDGYHIMLAPLSVGQHTLEFGGKLTAAPLNLTFIQDITYHITVTSGHH